MRAYNSTTGMWYVHHLGFAEPCFHRASVLTTTEMVNLRSADVLIIRTDNNYVCRCSRCVNKNTE